VSQLLLAGIADDAIFLGKRYFWHESLLQELKSPWELVRIEQVTEEVEFHPADWPEKHFFLVNR